MIAKARSQIVSLPTKSSTLGRTMTVDISHLDGLANFWKNGVSDSSRLWQVLADNYINKPYLDAPSIFSSFYDITYNDFTLHHRNHDTTHAVRQRLYSKNYINSIESYGREEYTHIASEIKTNPEIQACLELAVYLCRSGRTNEKSGQKDPSNAKRSAELFSVVATKLGFDPGLIKFLAFSIEMHNPKLQDYPELIANLPGEHKSQLASVLKGVLDLSHHTDLVRCKVGSPDEPVKEKIEQALLTFLDPQKINVKRATNNLLIHATQLCKMTGTRVKFQSFSQQDEDNNPKLKILHAKNVVTSTEQMKSIKLDLQKITHEGPNGDFDELLRNIPQTGILDLTNQQINPLQLEQIKKCIKENFIKKANLLGIKPVELQKELAGFLEAKSAQQEVRIEINHISPLNQALVEDFNKQFRQQAMDKEKISMKFEPSRLGAAWAKGIGSFFSQLWKEIKGDIPKFGGTSHFTQLTSVKKLSNQVLENQYNQQKKPVPPISDMMSKELQTFQTDDVQLEPGEMLLFHGTSSEVSPLIMQNGFNEERCKYVMGNGYGPLGKGVYFTSELSKAASFSTCSECRQSGQCCCLKAGTTQPADRIILVCKVFVGVPEVILKKGNLKERTQPNKPFDSHIALSNNIDPISDFRSTEVCVPSGKQVIPLYEIRFSSQPNLIQLSNWKKMITENGLIEMTELSEIKTSLNLLAQIQTLRNISAPFENIKERAKETISCVDKAIEYLTKKKQTMESKGAPNENDLNKVHIQLRDLHNLKSQLSTLENQNTDFAPRLPNKKSQTRNELGFTKKLLRLILLKEMAIKNESKNLAVIINKFPGKPNEFQDNVIEWLNLAIERNQYKGVKENMQHRIIMTQKMIHLRDALNDLKEQNLSEEDLNKKTHQLIGKTVNEFKDYGAVNPLIFKSTAYTNLCDFLETSKKVYHLNSAPQVTSTHLNYKPTLNHSNVSTNSVGHLNLNKPNKNDYQPLKQIQEDSIQKSQPLSPSNACDSIEKTDNSQLTQKFRHHMINSRTNTAQEISGNDDDLEDEKEYRP